MAKQLVEWPEARMRRVFRWEDNKTIQEAWSAHDDEDWRARFVKLVEGADDRELPALLDEYISRGSSPADSSEAEAGTSSVPTGDPNPQPGSGTEPPAPPAGDADPAPGPTPGDPAGQQGNDGPDDVDEELAQALDTAASAEEFAKRNPDRIEDLLAAEQRRNPPRKTLVEALGVLQRKRDKDREDL